ncbi:hypothetical protein AAC387_Pa07g3735 [Persea americana]
MNKTGTMRQKITEDVVEGAEDVMHNAGKRGREINKGRRCTPPSLFTCSFGGGRISAGNGHGHGAAGDSVESEEGDTCHLCLAFPAHLYPHGPSPISESMAVFSREQKGKVAGKLNSLPDVLLEEKVARKLDLLPDVLI